MRKKILYTFITVCFSTFLFSQEQNKIDEKAKADFYLEKLQAAYKKGDYKGHKRYSDSLLYVAKENNFYRMHVLALNNQAIFHNSTSERETSILLYHEALKICELIPEDFKSRTVVLVNMGNTYYNIGAYEKAIQAMEKVIEVADNAEDSYRIKAAALVGLADNYNKLQNYDKALKYAYEANVIGETNNNELIIASSINNILEAHLNLKEYQKVLDISTNLSDTSLLKEPSKIRGSFLLSIGTANYYLNKFDAALQYLNECKALAQEKNLLEVEMRAYKYLAKVYEQKENFEASYSAQKKYTLLKEDFLNDTKNAASIDLKQDISTKNKQITNLSEKRNQLLVTSILAIAVLSVMLFFYMRRKKTIELQQVKLRAQYQNLQQTVKALNTKTTYTVKEDKPLKPYKNSSLTQADRERFKSEILVYMNNEKPYLNPDLKQTDLALNMGISTHNFSEVLYYCFGQNFYNFINSYRVVKAQELIKSDTYKDAKIIAIAFDSGFKSKTSFNRVFKKHTGVTPSEYRIS